MRRLKLIIALMVVAITGCFAQGTMTMSTDKTGYFYGDSIQVNVKISNNTDSSFTLWGGTCMVRIQFDTVFFNMYCTTSMFPHTFSPHSSRTWTWVLVPSLLGIPTHGGRNVIYGYCRANDTKDSVIINEPEYYGGRIDLSYSTNSASDKIQKLRDELGAIIIYSDTLKSLNLVQEEWEIQNYSIDSLANIYSKDSLFEYFTTKRVIEPGRQSVTSVNKTISTPGEFKLYQNFPNPFNPVTTIKYEVPRESLVNLKIYSVLGKELKTLVYGEKPPGTYQISFNAEKYSSGVYFCVMRAGIFTRTEKLILMK